MLAATEVPVPDAAVEAEVEGRLHNLGHELEGIGQTLDSYLALQGRDPDEFRAELRAGSEKSVRATFVLDAIAQKEELGVDESDLSAEIVRRAQREGVDPQAYANQLVQAQQLPLLMGEIVRGKALALVLESAVVTDTAGAPVDLDAIGAPAEDEPDVGDEFGELEPAPESDAPA